MFFGPAGTGKTTLAKYIESSLGIKFLSGSISDLIPKTKDMKHTEMMSRDPKTIYLEDMQLLNLRSKLFKLEKEFVTDRSYLDIMAYHIVKLSKDMPECDSDSLFSNIATLMLRDCTHLIFIPFTDDMFYTWNIEDNNKRVLNRYFQWQVSLVMRGILNRLGFEYSFLSDSFGTIKPEFICRDCKNLDFPVKKIKVCILGTTSLETRKYLVNQFLS